MNKEEKYQLLKDNIRKLELNQPVSMNSLIKGSGRR